MPSDWLKLHRKALDSQVFSDPLLWHLFCWCLLRANWKTGFYLGTEIPVGSFATGRETAAESLGVSSASWYRRMKKLEEFGVVSIKANSRFTIITVEKWRDYQFGDDNVNSERTAGDTTNEQPVIQQVNTIEEGKKERRKERKILPAASRPDDVLESTWLEWVAVRKKKRAGEPTEGVLAAVRREADKAKWTLEDALQKCVLRSWTAFEAAWVTNDTPPSSKSVVKDYTDEYPNAEDL